MSINIYTDGACSGNPGIGGWGVVLINNNKDPIYLSGGLIETTNNQMELIAAIKALRFLKEKENITIWTDSKYLKDGIERWIINWKNNNWKNSSKKTVKNKELWIELDNELRNHSVQWKWLKAHAGHLHNEKADDLAKKFIKKNK